MSFSEMSSNIEQLISSTMGSAFQDVQRSLGNELRRHAQSLQSRAREEGLEKLCRALQRLDGATTQAELLSILLEEAGGYARRTALLLTFETAAQGWASFGFAGAIHPIEDLQIPYDGAWQQLAAGTGCVELAGDDCAPLCGALDAPLPQQGLLVPLVLRDRIAAVLYADRLDSGDIFQPLALQLLTFSAALLLEVQGTLRQRQTTPTLRAAGEAPGLALWEPEAVAQEATPPAAEAVPTPATTAPTAAAPAAHEASTSSPAAPSEPEPEAAAEEPEPMPAAAIEEPSSEAAEAAFEMEEIAPPPLPEPAPEVEEVMAPEQEAPLPVEEGEAAQIEEEGGLELEEASGFELEEASSGGEAAMAYAVEEPAPAADEEEEATGEDFEAEESSGAAPVGAEATVRISREVMDAYAQSASAGATETATVEPIEAPVPEAPSLEAAPGDEEPQDISEDRTVLLNRETLVPPAEIAPAPEPEAPAPTPPPAPPTPPTANPLAAAPRGGGGGTTEVAPPPDLDGPGWAFRPEAATPYTASPQEAPAPKDETAPLHEEARRLARLLVSEIKLYNEEQVEEGRRNHDIYSRLQEDIDRSRLMYQERVDPRVREEVDYFEQEMVNILAGGDADALGM